MPTIMNPTKIAGMDIVNEETMRSVRKEAKERSEVQRV
jgi:hypothetical protein